jgi:hypothetical protein
MREKVYTRFPPILTWEGLCNWFCEEPFFSYSAGIGFCEHDNFKCTTHAQTRATHSHTFQKISLFLLHFCLAFVTTSFTSNDTYQYYWYNTTTTEKKYYLFALCDGRLFLFHFIYLIKCRIYFYWIII